jgi:MFS family permease
VSSHHDTQTVVLSLIAGVFFGGVGGGVAFPTLPRLGSLLGFSALTVGIILAINRFTRMLLNTPAGTILDRFGTRRPMLVGFTLQGLAPFGYVLGLSDSWTNGLAGTVPVTATAVSATTFAGSRVLWGIGSAFVFVGAFSTVTKVTTQENRGKWTGYLRGGQSLGFPAGLVVGGLVANLYGFTPAFLVAGVAGLFAALVAFFVLPDLHPTVENDTRLREIPGIVASDVRILSVGVVNFVVRFLFAGVLLSTVVEYAAVVGIHIGFLDATGISGVVMAVSVLFSSGTTLLAGPASDRVSNRAFVSIPSLGFLAVGFTLLALVPSLLGTFVGVAVIGIGVEGVNIPLLAYLGDISPENDVGKLGGVYNVFGDFGSTLGPLVALPFAVQFSYVTEYLGCVLLVVVTAILAALTLLGGDDHERPIVVPGND